MHRLTDGNVRKFILGSMLAGLLASAALWLEFRGSPPKLAKDYEECVELTLASPLSKDERGALMTDCNARFAGRRKAGGGYTYYDFMQDRAFNIAGPNPTAEERKRIDLEYMGYLDAQRREAASAELAARQNEQIRADIERARQPAGPPLILTPPKRLAERPKPKHCEDGSLACSWEKLSTAVKNAFASSNKPRP